jgi:hypothetical protein
VRKPVNPLDFTADYLPEVPTAPVMAPELASDLNHRLGSGRQGMPLPKPYEWSAAGRRRDAQVAAQLAAIRAKLHQPVREAPSPVPLAVRCAGCGYLTTAPGHRLVCG